MKIYFLFTLLILSFTSAKAQYSISITIKEPQDSVIYFRLTTFDDNQYLPKDTITVHKGKAKISSRTPVYGGIYYLYFPVSRERIYLSIDNKDSFSISMNGNNLLSSIVCSNYKNRIFTDYQQLEKKFRYIDSQYNQIQKRGEAKLSVKEAMYKPKVDTLMTFRKKALTTIPASSILYTYFNTINQLDNYAPGKKNAALREEFLRNFNLQDTRLYFSPLYKEILYEYISSYPLTADSVMKAIDTLMQKIDCNNKAYPNSFHYIASVLQNNTIKENRDGYIHYIDKYLNRCSNFPGKNKSSQYSNVYNHMRQMNVTDTVANTMLKDTAGQIQPLKSYLRKNDYTIISFYDPGCEHCVIQMPEVDSIMQEVNSKGKIYVGHYAICSIIENRSNEWTAFIQKYLPNNHYIHVILGNDEATRKTYAAYSTPAFFVADKTGKLLLKKTNVAALKTFFRQ